MALAVVLVVCLSAALVACASAPSAASVKAQAKVSWAESTVQFKGSVLTFTAS